MSEDPFDCHGGSRGALAFKEWRPRMLLSSLPLTSSPAQYVSNVKGEEPYFMTTSGGGKERESRWEAQGCHIVVLTPVTCYAQLMSTEQS